MPIPIWALMLGAAMHAPKVAGDYLAVMDTLAKRKGEKDLSGQMLNTVNQPDYMPQATPNMTPDQMVQLQNVQGTRDDQAWNRESRGNTRKGWGRDDTRWGWDQQKHGWEEIFHNFDVKGREFDELQRSWKKEDRGRENSEREGVLGLYGPLAEYINFQSQNGLPANLQDFMARNPNKVRGIPTAQLKGLDTFFKQPEDEIGQIKLDAYRSLQSGKATDSQKQLLGITDTATKDMANIKLRAMQAFLEKKATPEQMKLLNLDSDPYLAAAAKMVNDDMKSMSMNPDEKAFQAIMLAETLRKASMMQQGQGQPDTNDPLGLRPLLQGE